MPKRNDLRQRIISLIRLQPTLTRAELSKKLGVTYQAVQKHLKSLENDQLVVPSFHVTDKWRREQDKFWVFIETQFLPPSVSAEGDAPVPVASKPESDGDQHYQRKLCTEITKELAKDTWRHLTFDEIHILLGGQCDILLSVYAPGAEPVWEFVTNFVRTRDHVVRTSTVWSMSQSTE